MVNKVKSIVTDPASALDKRNSNSAQCPLCHSNSCPAIHQDSHCKIDRKYHHCARCDLIFVPKRYHLDNEQEKAIYDCHENNPNDPGYRKFLSKLSIPLIKHLNKGAKGLDFGSGPGPTLSVMMREAGFDVEEYDPFYAPDRAALSRQYDFITSTEVVEHLSQPYKVFDQLFNLLNSYGVFGIMTKRPPKRGIEGWHYTKDPTHITFYSERTFMFIAKKYNCSVHFISDDTVILVKNS